MPPELVMIADIAAAQGRLAIEGGGHIEKRKTIFDEMHASLAERGESDGRVAGKRGSVAGRGALGVGMASCLQQATTGFFGVTAATVSNSRRPSEMDSSSMATTFVSGSRPRNSSNSTSSTSALLPSATILAKPTPSSVERE